MTLLCLISACQWIPSCGEVLHMGGCQWLHESCDRCGTRRYRRPGEEKVLFSLRPRQYR